MLKTSAQHETLPPAVDPVRYLEAVALVEATRLGYEHVIEHSDRSEATYVKVRRDGFWYGIRLASHKPYYRCSADYHQVLVPPAVSHVADIASQEADLVAALRTGGMVIADPLEVDEALFQAWRAKRHGSQMAGLEDTLWQWDEAELGWRLVRVGRREATDDDRQELADCSPTAPPSVRLEPWEQSAVRHRLNVRARWTFDEMATLAALPAATAA